MIWSIQLGQVLYYIKLKKGRLMEEVGTDFFEITVNLVL